MRGSVSSPGPGGGPWSAPASAASRSGPIRVRTPRSSNSNESVTGSSGSPSASRRSTASWRSSSSSKPRSRRSAMPPSTIRITASQSRPTGVVSSILSAGMKKLSLRRRGRCAAGVRGDRRTSNHAVAAHEARRLPRSNAQRRLVELERERTVAPGTRDGGDAAADRPRAVAQLHAVDLAAIAVKHGSRDGHLLGGERAARADDHAASLLADDVQRLFGGHPEPAALADGEAVLPVVAADAIAGEVDDLAARRRAAVAADEVLRARAGQEAEVLALGALRHGQVSRTRELAHLRLAVAAEREPDARELLRVEAGEHVGLVLALVDRRTQKRALAVVLDAGVVPRGELRGADAGRQPEHGVEAHEPVAAHARVRRAARAELAEEVVDHRAAEALAHVERDVRQAHPVRESACVRDRLR